MKRLARLLLVAAVLLAPGCDRAPTTAPPPAGLDPAAFDALAREVRSGVFGDVRSLLVATGDTPPAERYFNGARRDQAVPVYSITKSVTSLLTGLALNSTAIDSVDTPLTTLLPTRRTLLEGDALRAHLTLRNLLTMRAGVEWNELSTPYESPANPVAQMLASDDWIAYVLSRPMSRAPGTAFSYNSGASVVLGASVASAVGRALPDMAQDALFAPLGIPRPSWHQSANGVTNAGGGLSLRPVDLITIGRVVRDGGMWQGEAVIPSAWLEESLQPYSVAGLGSRYGYQWWLIGPNGSWDASHPIHMALGWGGQTLLIDRTHDLVVAITARNFDRDPLAAAQEWIRRVHATLRAPGGS